MRRGASGKAAHLLALPPERNAYSAGMRTLESCELFSGLNEKALAAVRAAVTEKAFVKGTLIIAEGTDADALYVVDQGEVEIAAAPDGATHRVVSRLGPGESFGEMAVVEDKPRSANVVAAVDCVVLKIPRPQFQTLMEQHPVLCLALSRQISRRLREFTQQYIHEALENERLALLGKFARAIVHDIKNPLNIIGISAQLLGEEDTPAQMRVDCVNRIRRQVDRVTEMVSEILEFTQNAQQAFVPAEADFARFIRDAVAEEVATLQAHGVSIEWEAQPPSVQMLLHPKRLRRVFSNLLLNAAEATQNRGAIRLRFREDEEGITTEIHDSGPGIPPEVANRLFDAFVTHGKPQGTGLGLAIARRIVTDHRGRLTAANSPEGGAVFTVWLPKPAHA
jgi:signal transduction histidine kinase